MVKKDAEIMTSSRLRSRSTGGRVVAPPAAGGDRPSPLLAALEHARRGWPTFPCHHPTLAGCSCGKKPCPHPGKHPLTAHGFKDATVDEAQIRRWWTEHPEANIAISTGPARLLVIDIDLRHGGDGAFQQLVAACPEVEIETVQVGTADGMHWYYRLPDGVEIPSRNGTPFSGIDIRGQGGYVITTGSRHPSGHIYAFAAGRDPEAVPIAPAPPALVALLRQPTAAGRRPVARGAARVPARIPADVLLQRALGPAVAGNRNEQGLWLATQLRDNGFDQEEARRVMQQYGQAVPQGEEPYTEAEAERTLDSAFSRPPREPWSSPPGIALAVAAAEAEAAEPLLGKLWQQWVGTLEGEGGRLIWTDQSVAYVQQANGVLLPVYSDEAARYFQRRVDREASFHSHLWSRAAGAVRSWAEEYGVQATVYRQAKVDWGARTAWIGCSDGRTVYKITSEGIERLPNGSEGVLIIGGCAPVLDRIAATGHLAHWLEHDTWATPVAKLTMAVYGVMLLLGAGSFAARPILAAIGGKGSGKTTTLQLLGEAVCGAPIVAQTFKPAEPENEARIVNEPLAIFDNVDNPPNPSVIEDFLATASTQQERAVRRMRVEAELVRKPITAFVAVTSFSVPPCIRRSDIVERSLIVLFQRPKGQKVEEMTERVPEREALYQDLLILLQRVLKEWPTTAGGSELRSSAFMRFARAILGAPAAALLEQSLLNLQSATAGLDDPILHWLEGNPPEFPMTAQELYGHWEVIAGDDRPRSPHALGIRLGHKAGKLGHWQVIGEKDEAKNLTRWRFERTTQGPGLTPEEALALLRQLTPAA